MAQEIAAAYVTLLPSAKGMAKGIEKELGGSFEGAEKRGSKSFGGFFGKVAKWGTAAVATVAGAFAGKAAHGGFQRLMGIEEAQAKLRGLGHDADSVTAIMDNALSAVRGTSFGMAEAATTAAGAVAAGIQPGKQLEGVLKSVANSASAAGVGMDEMGSIYNKVASLGKAQNDVLQQVADRGIPIYQALADQLGVTTDEVFDLASAGKIGFEEFEQAMTSASGTVAEEMGTTLRGSWSNFNAALSRIGANFLGGIFPLIAPAIQKLTGALGPVEDMAKRAGEAMGEWLTDKALPGLQAVGDAIGPVVDSLRNAFTGAGGGFSGLLAAAQEAFRMVVDWLSNGGIQMIADGFLAGRQRLLDAALELFPAIIEAAVQIIPQVVSFMSEDLLPGIIGVLVSSLPLLVDGAIQLFNGLIEGLVQVLPVLIQALTDALPVVLEALLSLLPALIEAAVELFSALVDGLLIALPLVLDALIEALPQILDTVLSLLPQLLEAAITLFMALATGIIEALPEIIAALLGILPDLVSTILDMVPELIEAAVTLFLALVTGLLDALPQLIGAITGDVIPQTLTALAGAVSEILAKGREWIEGLSDGVTRAWPAVRDWFADIGNKVTAAVGAAVSFLVQKGKDILTGLQNGINDGWRGVKDWFDGLGEKVTGALSGAGRWLYDSGRKIIGGLVDGIKSMGRSVSEAVGGVLQKARNLLPFSPAKEGPFSGRGWTLYSGRSLIDGLIQGLGDREGELHRVTRDLLEPLSGDLSTQVTAGLTVSGATSGGAAPGLRIGQLILQLPEWVRDFDTLIRFVRDLERQAANA